MCKRRNGAKGPNLLRALEAQPRRSGAFLDRTRCIDTPGRLHRFPQKALRWLASVQTFPHHVVYAADAQSFSQPIVPPFLRPKNFKIDKPPMTIKQILDLAENRANYRLPVFVHRSTLFHESVTSQQKTKMPINTSAPRTSSIFLLLSHEDFAS